MAKPQIKLKMGGAHLDSQSKNPSVAFSTATGNGPKLKLNFGRSKLSSPGEIVVAPKPKTKGGRAPKSSVKVMAIKTGSKHAMVDSDDDNEKRAQTDSARPLKKIKLNLGSKTPTVIKAKFKGKPPRRPPGEGYDSEASDREQDPVIEEEFVLRMIPGDDCDYLRKMIEEKKVGIPRKEGGADVQMKFIHPEGRRAVITVRGHHYAATLVDLPCIVEAMKSWDKKSWYKAADVCQMLHVFQQVSTETEAGTVELPKLVDPETFQFPHGLTPPMYYVRKRRFRKRISRNAIEAVEDAVEKLLEADANAESTRYEMIEPEAGSRQGSFAYDIASPDNSGEEYYEEEDQDAEGEIEEREGYFGDMGGNRAVQSQAGENDMSALEADLEADLEAAFEAEFDSGTPMSEVAAGTPDVIMNGGTPEASGQAGDDSGDDSSDGDDEDGDAEEDEIDEDERARLAELEGAKEDIADMEKQLDHLQNQMMTQVNPILKRRIKDNIEKVKAELQLKRSAIGEAEED